MENSNIPYNDLDQEVLDHSYDYQILMRQLIVITQHFTYILFYFFT